MDSRITRLQKAAADNAGTISLAGGLPAAEIMPRAEIRAALAALPEGALQYDWAEGNLAVRAWVASELTARGATIDAERVIVTAGAQQALSLAAASLAGAPIAVGEATYAGALDAFRAAGARPVRSGARVHYAITGVANPHGVELHDHRDSEIVIADEAYAELRFDGRVPRPVLADRDGACWHVGTIAKTLCPGLRVGWLVPPADAFADVVARKQAADLATSNVAQAVLAHVVARLDRPALLERERAFYARRAAALCAALHRHVPAVEFREPEGGFSIWVDTGEAGDDVDLLAMAVAEGVALDPGSPFRPATEPSVAFRLSFSNVAPEACDEAARRLARALDRWRRGEKTSLLRAA